jgi:uncharacterized DUF497 family protein
VPFEWDPNKAAATVAHASACRGELQFAGWPFYIFPKSALVARLYKKVGQALSPANSELQFARRDHIRIISARTAGRPEREQYEAQR